jgi:hypothetical protein
VARGGQHFPCHVNNSVNNFLKKSLDFWPILWYIITMKAQKTIKARVNKDGLMGSASREHSVKKGKGSFRRQKKHQKKDW